MRQHISEVNALRARSGPIRHGQGVIDRKIEQLHVAITSLHGEVSEATDGETEMYLWRSISEMEREVAALTRKKCEMQGIAEASARKRRHI